MTEKIPLLFDIKLMRPGCVLLAATFGSSSAACQRFNSEHWLTSMTPDLKVYGITKEELDILVERVNARPNPRTSPKRQKAVAR